VSAPIFQSAPCLILRRKLYQVMDYTTDDIEEAAGGKVSVHSFVIALPRV
jgi:hypothetical protein